jgi:hypothetical protein
LFVERDSATLAVVEVADGSIVDLHRQQLSGGLGKDAAAELATMVAGLDAPGSPADGVFVVGCGAGRGADVVAVKAALEAATALAVIVAEEPDMALARGAALASANAPLFASSTAALAYSLDPGTGEVNPGALTPTYLDVCGNAGPRDAALAYSALRDDTDDDGPGARRRRPFVVVGSALTAISAVAAGAVVVSLTSDARPAPPRQPAPRAVAPMNRVPPPQAQLPAPSPVPPARAPAEAAPPARAPEAAAPAAPPAPPPAVQQAPHRVADMTPAAPPRHAPTRRAPESVPAPAQAPAPAAPPPAPAAPPPEPPAAPAPPPQYPQYQRPPLTMYLHFPFFTVPIPINPPPPPAPPPPAP